MPKNTASNIIATQIKDPERLKQILFDHALVSKIEAELENVRQLKMDLDERSFVLGLVAGARIGAELLGETLYPDKFIHEREKLCLKNADADAEQN